VESRLDVTRACNLLLPADDFYIKGREEPQGDADSGWYGKYRENRFTAIINLWHILCI
jgi:hypothetical protein